ncbi:MAG: signal peptidase I [Firmicutes bacterium]|nr:signal peptidase I [Bacillota bacterium]
MKKVISVILDIVSAVLIGLATLVLILNFVGSANYGYHTYRVLTGSMEPAIKTNSLIVVHEEEFTEGDIISFFSSDPSISGMVNTHRVVSIDGDRITTKGDANDFNDIYPVSKDNVIGKVIFQSYFIGEVMTLMSNPIIFFGCIAVPLLIMLISSLMDAIRCKKELDENE